MPFQAFSGANPSKPGREKQVKKTNERIAKATPFRFPSDSADNTEQTLKFRELTDPFLMTRDDRLAEISQSNLP